MYKTVRHGENSLQYTILPQTEEVLKNCGLKGKGRDYSPSIHVRRSRRKSTVKYVMLILFGTIVALTLASVPLFVLNEGALARHLQLEAELTTAPLTPARRLLFRSRKKDLRQTTPEASTPPPVTEIPTHLTTDTSTPKITTEFSTTKVWIPPVVPEIITTTAPPKTRGSTTMHPDDQDNSVLNALNNNHILYRYVSLKPWDRDVLVKTTTVSPAALTVRGVFRQYGGSTAAAASAGPAHDLRDALLSVDDDEEFKEALEVDEVFSLPPLKPDVDDEVTISKAGGDWYAARWPFVDTSSYFQWTGYSSGDNLLLPLLIVTLSSIALIFLLGLAVRRRRGAAAQCASFADLQPDDNTNLLTEENVEEGEE